MDSFDKDMNELLQNQQEGNFPTGYSWEENADAIYSKMDATATEERKPLLLWWFAGVVLLVIVVATMTYVLDRPGETGTAGGVVVAEGATDKKVAEEATGRASLQQSSDEEQKVALATSISDSEASVQPARAQINSEASKISGLAAEATTTAETVEQSTIAKAEEAATTRAYIPVKYPIKASIPTMPTEATASLPASDNSTVIAVAESADSARERLVIWKVDQPSRAGLRLVRRQIASLDPVYVPVAAETSEQVWIHGLTVRGGMLLAQASYGGAPERNDHSTWLPGAHAALDYGITTQTGWSYQVGYSYNLAVQLFDFQSEDFVPVEKQDVVTHEVINALSGRTSEVRGDVSLEARRLRDFTTYNTYKSHAMSLLVSRNMLPLDSDWQINAGLGLRYSMLRVSSGYTLDLQSEIIDYTADQQIYGGQSMDVVGQLSIGRGVSRQLSLSAYCRANQSVTNWSMEADVTYRPVLVEVGVGLTYRWSKK